MSTDADNVATMVYFGALGSRIEGRYLKQKKTTSPAVLILPPDPRYKGTIDNDIVKTMEQVFQDCGFTTLTINYSGCGNSEGMFKNSLDGVLNASMALDWLQSQKAEASHFWIAGYSFGAYVAADLVTRRPELEKFVFVSPLIKQYDFSFICPSLCDGLVICGDKDDFINGNDLNKLVNKMNEGYNVNVTNVMVSDADHRFRNKKEQLANELLTYVNITLATRISKPIKKKRRKRQKKEFSTDV